MVVEGIVWIAYERLSRVGQIGGSNEVSSERFQSSSVWSSQRDGRSPARSSSDADRLSVVMLCEQPFTKAGVVHGCGQCFPCRFNRRRIWAHRIILEATQHAESCFVTLTYQDENLRQSSGELLSLDDVLEGRMPSLQASELRDFLKRLRKAIAPKRIRFYAVGEYGDETWRPHYHLALFGFPGCMYGRTRRAPGRSRVAWSTCCPVCRLVGDKWALGDVEVGRLEPQSASYLAGYVTKKMTAHDDARLKGRQPEFARMSLKPGIGYGALYEVAAQMLQYDLENKLVDVPGALRHGSRVLPLGRYLHRNLRKMVGHGEETPAEVIEAFEDELRPLREAAFAGSVSFAEAVARSFDQKRLNFMGRQKLKQKGKTL